MRSGTRHSRLLSRGSQVRFLPGASKSASVNSLPIRSAVLWRVDRTRREGTPQWLRPAHRFAQIPVASFADRTIRRLGAELRGMVAETELAVGRVRVTVRQETSGLYAVSIRRTDVHAGTVRQADEILLLVGPSCAGDEQKAQPRNYRQRAKRRGAASAVELGHSLGGHAVRTTAGHTRTLGRPPLGRSPHRPDAEPALCRRADVFALRRNL